MLSDIVWLPLAVLKMVMVEMRLFARGPQSASASGMDSWHLDFSAVSKKHSSRFRRDIVSRWSSSGIHTTYVGRHNFIQVHITHTHTHTFSTLELADLCIN